MLLYWNTQGFRSSASGDNILNDPPPVLYYASRPSWTVAVINPDGTAADLSGVVTWRAAVDCDLNVTTTPMCRTLSTSISVSGNAVTVPLECDTAEFLAAVNGKAAVDSYFELWGYDSDALPVFYMRIAVTASAVVDPDGGEPPEVPTGYITEAQTRALLANAATVSAVALRSASTAYAAGDRVIYPGKAGYVLRCTIAGTSAASAPSFPASVTSGATTLADGSVTWTLYDASAPEIATVNGLTGALAAKADASALNAKADNTAVALLERSTAYIPGDRVIYPGKAGYVLVSASPGTTDSALPAWPASVVSGTTHIYGDGTVSWTIYDATAPEIATVNGLSTALAAKADASDLSGKADTDLSNLTAQTSIDAAAPVDFVIKRGTASNSWFRIWKSGWVEQGGTLTGGSTASGAALNFPVKFSGTDFTLAYSVHGASATTAVLAAKTLATSISASGVTVLTTFASGGSNAYNAMTVEWSASGFGDATDIASILNP